MLGRVEVYLPGTHQSMQGVFELVFDVCVPGLRLEGLGPQVLQGIAAPQLSREQLVDLILTGGMVLNPIGRLDLPFDGGRHTSHLLCIAGHAYIGGGHLQGRTWCQLRIWHDRRAAARRCPEHHQHEGHHAECPCCASSLVNGR